jgi:acyl-CoA synthetase (NDP forming)
MPLSAQEDVKQARSARAPEESVARCRRILRPMSVAVVGASPRETTLHGRVVRNLLDGAFEGPVFPVNPRYDEVCGLPCHPSVEAIGQPVDLALVLVSADRVTAAVDDCIAGGVGAALIFSSGFAEGGPDGVARQAELDARRDAIAIGGPNVNAVFSRAARACMGFGPTLEFEVPDAPRALISQSGAVGTSIVTRAVSKGLGFRYVVATGNEVDLGVEDYLFALAAEPDPVRSCLLFLETIRDVDRFRGAAAQCAARGIRLIVLKAGRSERAQSVSATHTAALAHPIEQYRALFDQLGIWSVDTLDELHHCAQLDWWDDRADEGLAVVSFSGGLAALAADEAEVSGLRLVELAPETVSRLQALTGAETVTHPFDCGGQVVNDPPRWTGALEAMSSQPDAYGVLAILSAVAGGTDTNLTSGLVELARQGRNVALVWPSGTDPRSTVPRLVRHGVPVFDRIEDATRALGLRQQALTRTTSKIADVEREPDAGPATAERVLAAVCLDSPRELTCDSAAAASESVRELGAPVVLKATGLLHKSDAGGVRLDLRSEAEVAQAAQEIGAEHGFPLLIQQQVRGTREVLIGLTRSPLGLAVVIGAGGVLAELLTDTVTLMAPFQPEDARRAIETTGMGRLLRGFRHLAPADIERLAQAAAALARFGLEHDDVAAVDLNPVIISDDGKKCWAVDVKVVTREE